MKQWEIFRKGDIVRNSVIWGNKLFIVHAVGGNNYLPELYVHELGKSNTTANSANLDARTTVLVTAQERKYRKLSDKIIACLARKGNIEAIREKIMRHI